ncbi:MAG: diguanylate cyclase, partial [Thiohalobacterales bacterium]|nr:diguanylate cyclase [Thiohalobacterales bacterium]
LEARSNELAASTSRVEELSAELASLKEASNRRDSEQREEINRLGAEVRQLNETLQQREDQFRQREEELVARTDKLQGLNRTLHESAISESEMYDRKLEEKNREIDNLRGQLSSASEAPQALSAAIEQKDRLQGTLSELETRLREREDQCHTLGERARTADALEAEVARLTTALQEAGQPGDEAERLNAALEETGRLEAEVTRLNAALAEAGDAVSRENGNSEELESLRRQLGELQSALENTQAERDTLGERLAGQEALEQEVQHLKEALEQSNQRLQEQDGNNTAVESLNSEVASLRSALATAEERYVQLEAAHEEGGTTPAAAEEGMTLTLEPVEVPAQETGDSPDREQFLMHLNRVLDEPRSPERSGTVMYVLVDNFVRIRDEIGIMNSEQVITEVSGMIKSHCDGNIVTRFGDCSFAVLCKGEDRDMTREKAERIRVAIESHIFEVAGQSLITTTSIGICSIRGSDIDAEKVVARADLACESARTAGGNQVVVSSAVADDIDLGTNNDGHTDIVNKVLAEDRIKIYYQPISSLID